MADAEAAAGVEAPMPSEEEVERLYKILLDALLMPPSAMENLIKTQPIDKKWQMIQMNQVPDPAPRVQDIRG